MSETTKPVLVSEVVVKPGVKTSEFYLAAFAQLLGSLVGIGVIPTDSVYAKVAGFILAGLASLGYSYSRGKAKE